MGKGMAQDYNQTTLSLSLLGLHQVGWFPSIQILEFSLGPNRWGLGFSVERLYSNLAKIQYVWIELSVR